MSPESLPSSSPGGKKKTSSTPSRGGRGHGRDSSRHGNKPIEFDAKYYNNPAIKLALVFHGNTDMTMAFTPITISKNRFVYGKETDRIHSVQDWYPNRRIQGCASQPGHYEQAHDPRRPDQEVRGSETDFRR